MNNTRRSFLGSIGAIFTGVPFLSHAKKVKETFAVKIEEMEHGRWRATLKTSGFFGYKLAVIDSPQYDASHPRQAYEKTARLFLMFEIQRAMKLHVFPEDKDSWNNPMASAFSRASLPDVAPLQYDVDSIMARLPDVSTHRDYLIKEETFKPLT